MVIQSDINPRSPQNANFDKNDVDVFNNIYWNQTPVAINAFITECNSAFNREEIVKLHIIRNSYLKKLEKTLLQN